MAGAHLDSVTARTGDQRQRLGQRRNLETALAYAASGQPTKHLRFGWWGAEELGLVGSKNYVDTLTSAEQGEDQDAT